MQARYFKIHELVPKHIYQTRNEKAWELIDSRLIMLIDAIREDFGSATINNYAYGGERQWSGLRTPDSPWYSPTSQHSFGRAVDMLFKDYQAHEVREAIKANQDKYLTICDTITIEDDVVWLHIDVRNNVEKGLRFFKP